jgi:hypothetical protein
MVRMISSLSEAGYFMRHPPHPRSRFFFEQAVFQRRLGQRLFELTSLGTQHLDFIRGRLARPIARKPPLAPRRSLCLFRSLTLLGGGRHNMISTLAIATLACSAAMRSMQGD